MEANLLCVLVWQLMQHNSSLIWLNLWSLWDYTINILAPSIGRLEAMSQLNECERDGGN